MQTTPNANRKHITLFGNTNSGKSSLLNAMIGQEISIVSHVKGTTTDPVQKAMELLPYGPVVFIDTAGLDDTGVLGELRVKTTQKILWRTDFALYVMDAETATAEELDIAKAQFEKYSIPYMTVINKIDTVSEEKLTALKSVFQEAIFVSAQKEQNILTLKDKLIERLSQGEQDETILGDLIPYNGTVLMVVPVDSEAPKGRIILPQVQLIRDCLDHGIKCIVVRDTELQDALGKFTDIDLVVTDSQAFQFVQSVVPKEIKLTGFSTLFARHKGDLNALVAGVEAVKGLKDGDKILIAESCTHNHSHEDIGRVKIPKLLSNFTGKKLEYIFKMGHDFPENVKDYALVVHCGACMHNRKTLQTRIDGCAENGIPITNYGVLLAFLNGILDRSLEIFRQ